MVAASPRAKPTVAITTSSAAASSVNTVVPLAFSVSLSTTTPSREATTGFATVTVGSAAVSAPARNADCWKIIPTSATGSRQYDSGARRNAPNPPAAAPTAPLVSTANNASDDPATTASRTGATVLRGQTRAPSTHSTRTGPITAATASQLPNEPRACSGTGSPTATRTARATASNTAHVHSQRVTRCLASRA